jgi:O-antigen ligase
VALAVWALVLLVGWGRWKSIFAAGAIVLAVATFVLSPSGKGMVTRFTEPAEYMSVYTRTIGWEIAWERFLSHPLTGIGMNQGRYQADAMGDASAHNAMLDILMEEGIFGGIVFAAIVIAALRLCLRVRPFGYTGPQRTLRAALVSLLVGIMVNAPTITAIVIGTLFAWFLAWLSLQDSRPTTPRVEPDGLRGAELPGR